MITPKVHRISPTVVMYSFEEPNDQSNPYVKLLIKAVEDQVDVAYFSWSKLLRQRPDILHVHWPETMVRGSKPWKTQIKALLGIGYLIVRPLLGTKLVWTVHNASPHETEGILSGIYCRLVRRTSDHRIVINALDAVRSDPRTTTVVLHGTFRDWYSALPEAAEPRTPPVHLVFVGLIRPYKGVPELVAAFSNAQRELAMRLTIRGAINDERLAASIRSMCHEVPGIDLVFGHVDDRELPAVVAAANLVILPYRRLQNSGAALLALSLGRAVLLPETDASRELQREFGSQWVYLYQDELSPEKLVAQVRKFQSDSRLGSPDMRSRQWEDAGRVHVDIYKMLS